ncbi:MAG: hypothetical protein NZ580_00450 [Bacteroidia bacterium]|nr:hypothetical protein [Bacteroidia bacterium]MDW8235006.1 hypothetical protein [Bacteroidia bacterium]
MNEAFMAFLREKRIDPLRWMAAFPPHERSKHEKAFQLLGKAAYEQRYKFFFNRWRRDYPLSDSV